MRLPLKVQSQRPDLYIAPWPIELVSEMPAPNYDGTAAHPRAFTRIAHQLIPDCKPGQILECKGTFQMSNRTGEIVEFCAALVLTPSASGPAGLADPVSVSGSAQPADGKWITRMPGFNVTPNYTPGKFPYGGMHHAPFNLMADYVIPEGVEGDQYVAIISYAAGSSYSSGPVYIDQNTGCLSVKRWK